MGGDELKAMACLLDLQRVKNETKQGKGGGYVDDAKVEQAQVAAVKVEASGFVGTLYSFRCWI